MARRRRKSGNELEKLGAVAIGLVIFGLYRSGNLGQVLFGLGFLVFMVALAVAIYSLTKESKSSSSKSLEIDPLRSPKYAKARQQVNELMVADFDAPDPEEASPLFEIPAEWSLELLASLEWKRFETVCSEYLRLIGYDPKETQIGADGGVDIWVYKGDGQRPVGIVQCKAWTTYKVGVKPVRELYGVMAAEKVANGKFITSGEFTSEAEAFAEGKRLQLISGSKFLAAIRKLSPEKQGELLALALDGDYLTPTCPQCGRKMVLRRGRNQNSQEFWGCPGFPRCRSTLVYKPATA